MPVRAHDLLKALRPLLKTLSTDLLGRAKDPGVDASLHVAWEQEKKDHRTADPFPVWRRRRVDQVAIAWVLSVIFLRTLEDRDLLERRRIAGPGATDSEQLFTAIAPFLTARDYLLTVFKELSKLPVARDLFDSRHNPVWVLAPSADGARKLLDFFRATNPDGTLRFLFDGDDTRFLGDLYQDLSEDVRKRYALLQTPEFVEEFILSQTLDPALEAFGLDDLRVIDPTCGSGHFLLGAFHRLLDAWQAQSPAEPRGILAERAMKQVYGVDLNPYAVSIARFRLVLAFLKTAGIDHLKDAPRLTLNLTVADSLLHRVQGQTEPLRDLETGKPAEWAVEPLFSLENRKETLSILSQRYHAVVGNPPYITEKDKAKREAYRERYKSAAGKFALAAPFTERFFKLAKPSGFVGMINANSFTKRDFGKALIEKVLPGLDVSKVIDTSGAYIPGHGTPTLLLFGRNRLPGNDDVIAVLGKRGEAEEPSDPAHAPVWSEIVEHHDEIGFDGRYVSVEPIPREQMAEHPWVLTGGGARGLKERIEHEPMKLGNLASDIGFSSFTGMDDVFVVSEKVGRRLTIPRALIRSFVSGEVVRDWTINEIAWAITPYDREHNLVNLSELGRGQEHFWRYRSTVLSTTSFGGKTRGDNKEAHWSWYRWQRERYLARFRITFAFVATHNHFVLDRGGKVFNRTAPIIKLREEYDEDDHLTLLGVLNSSTALFWMKMVFFDRRLQGEAWETFFEFDSTKIKQLPVRMDRDLLPYSKKLDELARKRQDDRIETLLESHDWSTKAELVSRLAERRERDMARLEQMVGLQEELDWLCYREYGLLEEIELLPAEQVPRLRPGHRPFEINLANETVELEERVAKGDRSAGLPTNWFRRHGWSPSTTLPERYTGHYRELLKERQKLALTNKNVRFIEQTAFKRRWPKPKYDQEETEALRTYLLDRIEKQLEEQEPPQEQSARQIAAEMGRDDRFLVVAEVYTGESSPDLDRLVGELMNEESVPYLAAMRYTETGLEKYEAWKKTWALQRREDAGETVGDIPVPPKYGNKDFARASYWTHRGKLDVPKERFISYPGAETEGDARYGWAGWDHGQRAQALSGLYMKRKNEDGWDRDKLTPLLAGIEELVPWLLQWHNEPDERYGGLRVGDQFLDFVQGQAHELGQTLEDLRNWRPEKKKRGTTAGKAAGTRKKREPLAQEVLLGAFEGDKEMSLKELAEVLGESKAQVSKAAKAAVEAGELEQTSGRPKRWRRVSKGSLFDGM